MAASSNLITEEVIPYQFEPRRDDSEHDDDEGWITTDESENETEEVEKGRNETNSELWCTCEHCQPKKLSCECICCWEVEEVKVIMETEGLSK